MDENTKALLAELRGLCEETIANKNRIQKGVKGQELLRPAIASSRLADRLKTEIDAALE